MNFCAHKMFENAAIYLAHQKCNFNHQDSNGLSVLHVACMNNLSNLVSNLLELGANCNSRTKFVAAEKPRPGPPPSQKASVSSPIPTSPSPQTSERGFKKKTKVVKKKIVRRVLKPKKSSAEKISPMGGAKGSIPLNPFDGWKLDFMCLFNCSQTKLVANILVLLVFFMRFVTRPIFRLTHLTFRPSSKTG